MIAKAFENCFHNLPRTIADGSSGGSNGDRSGENSGQGSLTRETSSTYSKGDFPGSVLFVCTMNSIRSPMAEFICKDLVGNKVFVQSAGIQEGISDGFMHTVMAERGLKLDNHEPKLLTDLEDNYFDRIFTLSPQAHHQALELTRSQAVEVEYWPIFDPSTVAGRREQILDAYRQCRDQIEGMIKKRFGL